MAGLNNLPFEIIQPDYSNWPSMVVFNFRVMYVK